jgi:endogenous inhibitor of DNA gyrase (YacG/DUF329 family)
MFFFIGGIQPKTIVVDKQARPCPACGHIEVYLKRVDHYLSLFFIPLFPVKKGTSFFICENCNTTFDDLHRHQTYMKQDVSIRNCPYCWKEINPDFKFCPYCGKNLKTS